MRRNSVKLSYRHKSWLYSSLILIYVSGVAWACLHYFVRTAGEFGDQPNPAEPWSLKLHGAAAMVLLVILGTLLPGHVRLAWHARRNRPNGIALVAFLLFLVVTGYGLYYFGNERLRSWTSWSHLAVGLVLPAKLILHIWVGRRSAPAPIKSTTTKADSSTSSAV